MKILDWADKLMVLLSVSALVIMMILVTTSVGGRYFLNSPIPNDLVFSEILMVFVVFLPMGYVQARREHIFVTIFTDWLPSRTREILDIFGMCLGVVVIGVITAASWKSAYRAWDLGSYYSGTFEIIEWPGRLMLVLGLGMYTLRLAVDAVMSTRKLLSSKPA